MVLHSIDEEADNCENNEEDDNDERDGDVSFNHYDGFGLFYSSHLEGLEELMVICRD
jgi:hypothetical protein